MLFDELWETAVRDVWRLALVEPKVLAIGALIIVAVLTWDRIRNWKRTRRVEVELRKMEKKVYILEMQESGRLARLVRELNAKSRVKIDAGDTEVEIGDGDGTAATVLPPATADQRESGKSTKLSSDRRPVPCRRAVAQR